MFGLFKKKNVPVPTAPAEPVLEKQKPASWLSRLGKSLSKTKSKLSGQIHKLFLGHKLPEETIEELETILLSADVGVEATAWLIDRLREAVKQNKLNTPEEWQCVTKHLLTELLLPLESSLTIDGHSPFVLMVVGVNGAGKTTSIGKLAKFFQLQGKSVLLAAADTFRAAAQEQLVVWGQRNGIDVIRQEGVPPATVAYNAVQTAVSRKNDIVIIDTAGRLTTQSHLMDEIAKVRRVIGKACEGAPHEVLLVLDGTVGQNALQQVTLFDDALQVTGLLVTKLDGTAKGGSIAAIAKKHPVPLRFIAIGEAIDDLQPFSAQAFVEALFDSSAYSEAEPTLCTAVGSTSE